MYQLVRAIAKSNSETGRWKDVDIGNMQMPTLFSTYVKTIAILTNPVIPHPVSLDLSDIRAAVSARPITLNQYLAEIGTQTLPTSDKLPEIKTKFAKYADAVHAGYKFQPVASYASPGTDLPPSELRWLHMTRPNTDYGLLHRSCLVSVNGFYHRTEIDSTGVYIVDGGATARKTNDLNVGLYSFRELGAMQVIPLTENMIFKQKDTVPLSQKAYIDLGLDLTNKTAIFVIGGYLHILDNDVVTQVGDGIFCIDMHDYPLMNRFYESREYMDYSAFDIYVNTTNPEQIAVADIQSDAFIRKYLSMSQSFVMLLDNAELFKEMVHVKPSRMPGMFTAYTKPSYPLVIGHGRACNYWYSYEEPYWSLTAADSFLARRVFYTVDPLVQNSVDNSRVPEYPVSHSNGNFLVIGSDLSP